VEVYLRLLRMGGREVILATVRDVSERRRMEEALRASEERWSWALRGIDVGVWDWNLENDTVHFSSRWKEMLGYREDEVGGTLREWSGRAHPEDLPRAMEAVRAHLEGRTPFYQNEHRMQHKDGTWRWILDRGIAIRDASGRPIRMIGSHTDITERKRAEQALEKHTRELENTVSERTAQLRETIQELEAFSYSLSHDMRAPLRAMKGFSQILQAEYAETLGAEGNALLQRIASAAGRLDQLIQDVLTYSRIVRERIRLEPVDLEILIHQLIDENPLLQSPRALITIQSPLHRVLGHEAYLTQVLSNLIYNSVKFVAPGQQPRIHIWTEEAGDAIQLAVQDNGIGIPLEAQPRLFRMFERFHTDQAYEGTGIGLTIVRKAVERMGGRITLQSEENKGTTFFVRLQKPGPDEACTNSSTGGR
jgi:PAS domain S-box-containing protein